MSPTPLAPRSFLEVPVNSEQRVERGGSGLVGSRGGSPMESRVRNGVGTLKPVFVCHTEHMCAMRGAYVSDWQMSCKFTFNSSGDIFISGVEFPSFW